MKYYLILFSLIFSNFQPAYSNSIQVDLKIREDLDKQGFADAFIVLKQQADLSATKNIRNKNAKGKYVYNTLLKHARTQQASLIQWLEKENISYTSFFISNGIFIQIKPSILELLLLRDDIKAITSNPSFPVSPTTNTSSLREKALGAWGIAKVKADSVWNLGFEGQGVVVAGQDTGYEWFHPSIQKKYRGYNAGNEAQHDYNWHDAIHQIDSMHGDSIIMPENNPCGLDATVPCDDHSHGTHTMATMVGETDEEIFGLAPKATWIGCRCMERGYGTPFTYLECFEWFLAPTDADGNNPDPRQAPHVINNSWGCPELEGCNQSNFELLNLAIENLRSAGVVVVVSAGNGGRQGCATVDDPPAIYDGSFAVGATDINDTIAPFSSKGPVLVDGSNRTKPNISAPGVGIRSAVRGGGYAAWSGTSMAGPHVAGAVALLISAVPELAGQVEEIETLLEETADPLTTLDSCGIIPGTEVPNLTYGYGRLNVYKAIQKALNQYSSTREIKLKSFTIYPNPGNGIVQIKWEDNLYFERLLVFDGLGRILIDKPINNQPSLILETDHLEAGIYWVELYNQGQRAIEKYIKL